MLKSTSCRVSIGIYIIISMGCASGPAYVIEPQDCAAGKFDSEILLKAEQLWAARSEKRHAEQAAEIYAEIARCTSDYPMVVLASRSAFWYAEYFLTGDSDAVIDQRRSWFETGINFGKRALALDERIKEKIEAGETLEEVARIVGPERIEALFWTAANLGRWLMLESYSTALINRVALIKMIERVVELDSAWYCGAGFRAQAILYTMMPNYAGRDLETAAEFFKKAIVVCPEFLESRVLMAEYLAPLIGGKRGRKLFIRNLRRVLKTPRSEDDPYAAENEMARRRAAALLARGKEIFTR